MKKLLLILMACTIISNGVQAQNEVRCRTYAIANNPSPPSNIKIQHTLLSEDDKYGLVIITWTGNESCNIEFEKKDSGRERQSIYPFHMSTSATLSGEELNKGKDINGEYSFYIKSWGSESSEEITLVIDNPTFECNNPTSAIWWKTQDQTTCGGGGWNGIEVFWISCADEYEIEYGPKGFIEGEGRSLTENASRWDNLHELRLHSKNLDPAGEFSFAVRSKLDGVYGEWSDRYDFMSEGWSSIDEEQVIPLIVYPNPTDGEFKVELTNNNVTKIHVTNLSGAKVKTFNYQESYDISDLPSGLYFVTVWDDKTPKTQIIQKR